MKSAFKIVFCGVRALDRMLPALLLFLLLSWQNTVHAGAASWVFSPELVAADGRLLSVVDFCNRGPGADAQEHCADCQLSDSSTIPEVEQKADYSENVSSSPGSAYHCDIGSSPETACLKGRAPPFA